VKHSSLPQGIQVAAEAAARSLPPDDPSAHVFYEDRVDLRVVFGPDGHRERSATRATGGTVAGRHSIHASDLRFASGLPEPDPPDMSWLAGVEDLVVQTAQDAANGRPATSWTASLVSFRQDVWVVRANASMQGETRRGSRLELQVRRGKNLGWAAADVVLHPNAPQLLQRRFDDALDRLEDRNAGLHRSEPGACAAVFAPGAAGVVAHELIGHALEGDGPGTWLHGMTELPCPAKVTVIDDPRRGRGAWHMDDEGTPTGATVLIDGNRVVGCLHDRSSAERLGLEPTGHGRRASYLDPVLPRMGCTYVEAGTDDPADILRTTRSGVFIRRLVAGHTDPTSGRASFTVTDADRIVGGRCAGPIESFVLELEARNAMPAIDHVAHDLAFDTCIGSCVRDGQPLAVSVGAPTIRIGVVMVCS
jgi:predicted Zn-dependent protease